MYANTHEGLGETDAFENVTGIKSLAIQEFPEPTTIAAAIMQRNVCHAAMCRHAEGERNAQALLTETRRRYEELARLWNYCGDKAQAKAETEALHPKRIVANIGTLSLEIDEHCQGEACADAIKLPAFRKMVITLETGCRPQVDVQFHATAPPRQEPEHLAQAWAQAGRELFPNVDKVTISTKTHVVGGTGVPIGPWCNDVLPEAFRGTPIAENCGGGGGAPGGGTAVAQGIGGPQIGTDEIRGDKAEIVLDGSRFYTQEGPIKHAGVRVSEPAELCPHCGESPCRLSAYHAMLEHPDVKPLIEAAKSQLRCLVTGNPCGTDTWAVGHPCECSRCRKFLEANPDPRFPTKHD
jgi:hypothetical protein